MLGVFLARDLASPLYTIWLNAQITDSTVRGDRALDQRPGERDRPGGRGPVLGAIGNVWGVSAALTAGAAAIAPAHRPLRAGDRHEGREPELDQLPEPDAA
jgi:hypothetical protein